MSYAMFRIQDHAVGTRWARGTMADGPTELLSPDVHLNDLLADSGVDLARLLETATHTTPCPPGARVLAPIEDQEVWCAGVSYERSRDARMEESSQPDFYDLVYDADRPELFFKANGWRVRGPGEPINVRDDSGWDMAEPELGLVIAADGVILGYVIGNDMSSRTIEGENPLYLPQAKVYDGSCALGPAIVPATAVAGPLPISMTILRGDRPIFSGTTSSGSLKRTPEELVAHLYQALAFPVGAVLLTGTGIVPDASITVTAGDIVHIEIDGLGVLQNPVESIGRSA